MKNDQQKIKVLRAKLRTQRVEARELRLKVIALEGYKQFVSEIFETLANGDIPNKVYWLKFTKRFWK